MGPVGAARGSVGERGTLPADMTGGAHPTQHDVDEVRASARRALDGWSASRTGRVDRELLRRLSSGGLVQQLFPAVMGGAFDGDEVSATRLCLLREAVAMESTDAETALAMQGLGGYPILQ